MKSRKKNQSPQQVKGNLSIFPFLTLLVLAACINLASPVCYGDTLSSLLKNNPYSEQQLKAIEEIFKKAEEEGILEDLILPRLEEGIAKKVSFERILDVLTQEIEHLKISKRILLSAINGFNPEEHPELWSRAAILLASGISEQDIQILASASASRLPAFRNATTLYVSLLRWRLEKKIALNLVTALLDSSLDEGEFHGVMNILIMGRKLYIPPEELSERIIKELPDSTTLESIKEKVLY
jgi:hypothetical protein